MHASLRQSREHRTGEAGGLATSPAEVPAGIQKRTPVTEPFSPGSTNERRQRIPHAGQSRWRRRPPQGIRVRAGMKNDGGRLVAEDNRLQVAVSPQPLDLGSRVPVHDIALAVLEGPGHHEQDVPLANPDPFLDLPLDPAHPGDPVKTPHPDMVGPHHQFSAGKDLPIPLVRKAYPDDLLRRFALTRSLVSQYINSIRPRPGTSGSP